MLPTHLLPYDRYNTTLNIQRQKLKKNKTPQFQYAFVFSFIFFIILCHRNMIFFLVNANNANQQRECFASYN